MSVGPDSIWAGAKRLKVSTCNRDRKSARVLWTPRTCLALERMLFCKHTRTNFLTKTLMIYPCKIAY